MATRTRVLHLSLALGRSMPHQLAKSIVRTGGDEMKWNMKWKRGGKGGGFNTTSPPLTLCTIFNLKMINNRPKKHCLKTRMVMGKRLSGWGKSETRARFYPWLESSVSSQPNGNTSVFSISGLNTLQPLNFNFEKICKKLFHSEAGI